jgi:hypothetical protein
VQQAGGQGGAGEAGPENAGASDQDDDNSGEEAGMVGATEPTPNGGLKPVTDTTPEALVVFVTSTRHTAALGGLEGADELCNATASAAALDGTFRAWLSTRDTAVSERLRQFEGPYVRTDGVRIADGWSDLVDGSLRAAISVDERGNAGSGDVWTGTLGDGTPLLSDDCGGFTIGDSSGRAQCGNSTTTSSAWTQNLTPSCSLALRVYCFEQ